MKSFLKAKVGPSNKENCDSQLLYNLERKARGKEARGEEGRRRDKDAFVERVNGYIETISLQNRQSKGRLPNQLFEGKSRKRQKTVSRQSSEHTSLAKKLRTEKEINKNLQKCIIQIQKILWERNDRLQALEQQLTVQHLTRDSYEQEEQASEESVTRVRTTEGELKRYGNSLGLKKILNSLKNQEIEETSQYSDAKNSPSETSSIDCRKSSYIKIERPRTESQSEKPSKRRK